MTREPNVSLGAISKVVQNDPGLAAKVLKTVNSSFYGLQQPCSRLDRAMSYLGLQAVKSLVLGFSLVDATRGVGDGADLKRHWRRTIFAASAARHLAQVTKAVDADEVFACALFQDIGVLACVAALGGEYMPTLAGAPDDHDLLCRHEREVFPFDHTTVGAELARKWKLPDLLVESIRKHHVPDASGLSFPAMVRTTALSMYVAEALSTPGQPTIVSRLGVKASAWFGIEPEQVAMLLRSTATSAMELAKLFEQDVAIPDASMIMAEAQEALVSGSIQTQRDADRFKAQSETDTLTGVGNRRRFDSAFGDAFRDARENKRPLSVVFLDADRFKSVNDTLGHSAGDAVLKAIASRCAGAIAEDGMLCRFGGEEFAAFLPGFDGVRAKDVGERLRRAVADRPIDLSGVDGAPPTINVTISVGVATMESGSGSAIESHEQLLSLADQAVYAAKSSGRNCVRAASPAAKQGAASAPAPALAPIPAPVSAPSASSGAGHAAPQARAADSSRTLEAARSLRASDGVLRVLVVDDDPLAAKLLSMIFQRLPETEVRVAHSGASASAVAAALKPTLVIVDHRLHDTRGMDLIPSLRASVGSIVRAVLITATPEPGMGDAARAAGADLFASKADMSNDVSKWIHTILSHGGSAPASRAA